MSAQSPPSTMLSSSSGPPSAVLEQAGELLASVLNAVDPEVVGGEQAASLAAAFVRLEAMCASGRITFTHRATEAARPRLHGKRGQWDFAAGLSKSTVPAAKISNRVANELRRLPSLAEAFRRGEVSARQVIEITQVTKGDDDIAARLLRVAASEPFHVLSAEAARCTTARGPIDEAQRYARLHRRRSVEIFPEVSGMVTVKASLPPQLAAILRGRLTPFITEAFRQGHATKGRRPTHRQAMADALISLVETSGTKRLSQGTNVNVIVSHEALVRGYRHNGEICEIEGIGSIPVAMAHAMAQDTYLSVLLTKAGKPALVRGVGRYVPPELRLAVRLRDGGRCQVPGCGSPFRLQLDHLVPLAKGGPTTMDNLRCICDEHHMDKTFRGWDWATAADGSTTWQPPARH